LTKRRNISAREVCTQLRKSYQFGEYADFSNCNISGDLNLQDGTIFGCDFSGTHFLDQVRFHKTLFRGLSWFKNTTFDAAIEFSKVCFANDARFDATTFYHSANFEDTEFRGVAVIDTANFHNIARFNNTIFNSNLSAEGCRFDKAADFTGSILMGGLWCSDSMMNNSINLDPTRIYGRTVLINN
jgi:uncharacterized protein YjbI with pentapeptide repeats